MKKCYRDTCAREAAPGSNYCLQCTINAREAARRRLGLKRRLTGCFSYRLEEAQKNLTLNK
jgi:hypothetical protein